MRLFGKVDGVIDRLDRAGWLTMPFDLLWTLIEASKLFYVYLETRSPTIEVEDRIFEIEAETRVFAA